MNNSRQLVTVESGQSSMRAEIPPPPAPRLLPDPRILWTVFRRNIKLFLALFGAVWLVFLVWAVLSEKVYSSQASILFEDTQLTKLRLCIG